MSEKLKNERAYLLSRDEKSGKVKAVSGLDENGNIQTVDPNESNLSSLLNVNTNDMMLESFLKKMLEQSENPAHTGLFVVAESILNSLIKIDFNPEELEKHRVVPAGEFQPLDVEKIDRNDMEAKGISWDAIEPHLKAMSYGHKSNKLVEMNPAMPDGTRIPAQGRVSLQEQPDGSIKVIPHYYQKEPNLDTPLFGVTLDDKAKTNLLITGHAGEPIELELTPGKKEHCFVSLDKLTNTTEVWPVSELGDIKQIKGAELSPGQQLDFAAGKKITLERMVSRSGYLFDGHVQVDASNKNFQFTYDGLDRNRYAQENGFIRGQKREEQGNSQSQSAGGDKKLTIPRKILGADVPEEAYKQWTAAVNDPSKQATIQAHYIKGMKSNKQDEPFNAWVRPNFEKGKMDFFKWKPKQAQTQGTDAPSQKQNTDTPKQNQQQNRHTTRTRKNSGAKIS